MDGGGLKMLVSTAKPPAGTIGLTEINKDFCAASVGAKGIYPRRHFIPKFVEPFDNISLWDAGYNISKSADTDNYICSAAITPQSMKCTKVAGGTSSFVTKTISETNLSDTLVYVRFYVHEGSGASSYENISTIRLFVGDSDFSNYQIMSLAESGYITAPGWYERVIAPKLGDMEAGTYSSCWEHVEKLRVRVDTVDSDDTPVVTWDKIMFVPQLAQSRYAITFDDGFDDDYDFAAYLSAKGIRGTFFIIPSKVGTSGRLTLEQLHRMQKAGHLIANHSWSHKSLKVDNLTDAEFIEEITKATDWMCANGFTDGARIFALAGGTANWEDGFNDIYKNRWFDQLRLSTTCHDAGFFDATMHWTLSFDNATTAESKVNKLTDAGTIMVTGWHSMSEGTSFTWADWKTHVDNVAAKRDAGNLDVVTMADLLGIGD
jgi:peptidoglycan/xylan/chitin deacetylase (PgdA/CDA1 family)